MKKLALLLPVVFLGLACSGRNNCPPVTAFMSDEDPAMTTSPVDADYILYAGKSEDYMARTHLRAGEPIGFKRDAVDNFGKLVGPKGSIAAVAGDMILPLPADTDYEWRRLPYSSSETKTSNPYFPHP